MNNIRENNFRNSIRYDVTKANTPTSHQNSNLNRTNPQKKNIKDQPTTKNTKYKRNILKSITIGALAAALAIGGIAIGVKSHNDKMNIFTNDKQSQIEASMLEEFKKISVEDLVFEGNNVSASVDCKEAELHNVLSNTNLDAVLNEYIANPTEQQKEQLLNNLEGIAQLNFDMIKASFADGLNKTKDDVSITVSFLRDDDGKILKGNKTYAGHNLKINNLYAFKDSAKGTYNYSNIPKEIFDLVSDVTLQLAAPEFYNDDQESRLNRLINSYKQIQEITYDEYQFTIKDNKACLVKDDKYYDYSKSIFGNAKFKDIAEDREI